MTIWLGRDLVLAIHDEQHRAPSPTQHRPIMPSTIENANDNDRISRHPIGDDDPPEHRQQPGTLAQFLPHRPQFGMLPQHRRPLPDRRHERRRALPIIHRDEIVNALRALDAQR